MNPYFFGDSNKQLFGVYHPPTAGEMRTKAVLICHAFDHEYMRTHWAFRRLADNLSREGFHVLRFDYFGTGDSAGDSTEVSLQQCREDILTAAEELRDVSGIMQLSVVSVRLGAALVMTTQKLKAMDFIFWEPVISGKEYLNEQASIHDNFVKGFNKSIAAKKTTEPGEAIGQEYSSDFIKILADLDCSQLSLKTKKLVTITAPHRTTHSKPLSDLANAQNISYAHHAIENVGRWEEISSGSILPTETINTIVRNLTGK